MNSTNNSTIDTIKQWLEKTIIGLNLCPFANGPYKAGTIRINETAAKNEKEQVDFFLDELSLIQSTKTINTSLIIFKNGHRNFKNFYNLTTLFEDLLDQLKLTEEFQVVCFHPKFIFENELTEAKVNFVNRSPYPLVHILRSIDIEQAINSPKEGEQISFNNEKTLNSLSDAEFLEHFPSTFYQD